MNDARLKTFVMSSDIVVPKTQLAEVTDQMTRGVFHKMRYEHMFASKPFDSQEVLALEEEIRAEAFLQLKTQLVLEDIIRTQNFSVSAEELEAEAAALAKRQNISDAQLRDFLGEDLSSLEQDILYRKAVNHIDNMGDLPEAYEAHDLPEAPEAHETPKAPEAPDQTDRQAPTQAPTG